MLVDLRLVLEAIDAEPECGDEPLLPAVRDMMRRADYAEEVICLAIATAKQGIRERILGNVEFVVPHVVPED